MKHILLFITLSWSCMAERWPLDAVDSQIAVLGKVKVASGACDQSLVLDGQRLTSKIISDTRAVHSADLRDDGSVAYGKVVCDYVTSWHGNLKPGDKFSFLTVLVPMPEGSSAPPNVLMLEVQAGHASVHLRDFSYSFPTLTIRP